MFNYTLSSQYSNILKNKDSSTLNYSQYINFLLDVGMLEELELESKRTNYKFNLSKYNNNLDISKFKFNTINNIEDLYFYTINHQFSYEIYNTFFEELFHKYKPSTNTNEQNLLFCYFINLSIKHSYLQSNHAEIFINFLARCNKVNLVRREHCFISITKYMLKFNNYFLKFRSGYSHHQIILNAIKSTKLLDSNIKRDIQIKLFRKIKFNNDFEVKKDKKIAVCISGMYRGHEQSLHEINENIVVPLNADVFMHTWNTQANWPGIGGTASFFRLFGHEKEKEIPEKYRGVNNIFKIEDKFPNLFNLIKDPVNQELNIEQIKNIFSKIDIEVEDQNYFKHLHIEKNMNAKNTRYKNQLKMFYGIYKSFTMALKTSLEYDFIIRIRPDVTVDKFNSEAINNLEKNVFYGLSENIAGPTDVEFICSSHMALSFINLFKNMFSQTRLNPFNELPDVDSHRLILLWLIDNEFSLGDDIINTKILDSQNFKDFKDLDKVLQKDISNLSKNEISEEAQLIDFFKKIIK